VGGGMTTERRDQDVEWSRGRVWGGGDPLPSQLVGMGSVVSSPGEVRAENDFWCRPRPIYSLKEHT